MPVRAPASAGARTTFKNLALRAPPDLEVGALPGGALDRATPPQSLTHADRGITASVALRRRIAHCLA